MIHRTLKLVAIGLAFVSSMTFGALESSWGQSYGQPIPVYGPDTTAAEQLASLTVFEPVPQVTIQVRFLTLDEETRANLYEGFHPASLSTYRSDNDENIDPANTEWTVNRATMQLRTTPSHITTARLGSEGVGRVLEALQGETESGSFQAPLVSILYGQQAVVKDTSQRPFVVGMDYLVDPATGETGHQPQIKVCEEGVQVHLQVNAEESSVLELNSRFIFNRILDVEEYQVFGPHEGNLTVQAPIEHRIEVEVSELIRSGESLWIDPYVRQKASEEQTDGNRLNSIPVIGRVLGGRTEDESSDRWTVILIEPTPIGAR